MKRILGLITLALMLAACGDLGGLLPEPEPPKARLVKTWDLALDLPEPAVAVDYTFDHNDDAIYAAMEERPIDGSRDDEFVSVWRVAEDGTVTGPYRTRNPELDAELRRLGERCLASAWPELGVAPDGGILLAAGWRNGAAQDRGCDEGDIWGQWTGLLKLDEGLNLQGFQFIKTLSGSAYDADVLLKPAKGGATWIPGTFAESWRADDRRRIQARYSGLPVTPRLTGERLVTWGAWAAPDGGYFAEEGGYFATPRFGSQLRKYRGDGSVAWTVRLTDKSYWVVKSAVVLGADSIVISGYYHSEDGFAGAYPPQGDDEYLTYIARFDGGRLTWLRRPPLDDEKLMEAHYTREGNFPTSLAYDAELDLLYVGFDRDLLGLDPATGRTRWLRILDKDIVPFINGTPEQQEFYLKYQPQHFVHIKPIPGEGIVGVFQGILDVDTPTSRFRPVVVRFDWENVENL